MTEVDVAMVILRVVVGVVFLAHGVKHARGRVKTSNWFGSIGFRSPELQWFFSTATEIGIGVLLIAGLATSLVAAGVIGVMAVAYWTVHRAAGFWITARPDEGWEYVFVLSAVALAIAVVGPGSASLDAALDIDSALNGWVGAVLALGGAVIAAGQLAVFYRPGDVEETPD